LCGTARYFIKTSYDSFDSQELYALHQQDWFSHGKKFYFFLYHTLRPPDLHVLQQYQQETRNQGILNGGNSGGFLAQKST
jgi:hypothetical protein